MAQYKETTTSTKEKGKHCRPERTPALLSNNQALHRPLNVVHALRAVTPASAKDTGTESRVPYAQRRTQHPFSRITNPGRAVRRMHARRDNRRITRERVRPQRDAVA